MAAGAGLAIGSALGGALGGLGSLFSDDAGAEYMQRALELMQQVQDPQFDFRQLTAPELQFIAEIDPVTYEARVPDDVKLAAESTARPAQARALAAMEAIGREGLPLADRLAAQQATEAIAQEGGRAQEAILQDLAARGRLGGGTELQARLAGSQAQNQLRAELGRSLAQEAMARRFAGLESAGGMAGTMREQDLAREMANAEMINRMNQYVAGLQTDAERWAAEQEMMNRVREAEGQQRVSEANRMLDYENRMANMARWNELQRELADFRLRRAGGEAGALGGMAESARAEAAAREQNLQRLGQGIGGAVGAFGQGQGWWGGDSGGTGGRQPSRVEYFD